MCSLLPQYRTEATHVCSTAQLTIARRADVSSGPASLYSPNIIIQSEKEDSSKVEKRPLLYISYNNCLFSSVSINTINWLVTLLFPLSLKFFFRTLQKVVFKIHFRPFQVFLVIFRSDRTSSSSSVGM